MASLGNPRSIELRKLLAGILPALPPTTTEILEMGRDPATTPADFALTIECDPWLPAKLLRFVNSSYFDLAREITSVRLAMRLVGSKAVQSFSLWTGVLSRLPDPKVECFDMRRLWQDSLRRGFFARATARLLGLQEADEVFTAALLQDMALPLLVQQFPDEYSTFFAQRESGKRSLSELETERFGWTHADGAGQIARIWRLPPEIGSLLAAHTDQTSLSEEPRPSPSKLAVVLSGLLPSVADESWPESRTMEVSYQLLRPLAGPPLGVVLERTDADLAAFLPALNLAPPERALADWFVEAAAQSDA